MNTALERYLSIVSRTELRPILDIRRQHRIDIERQAVARGGKAETRLSC